MTAKMYPMRHILVNAHHTIQKYTDQKAAQNYPDRLNRVVKKG
jgi:hypothetical protein